jgi:hypothetical protein
MIATERGQYYIGGKLHGISIPKRVFHCATPADTRANLPSEKVGTRFCPFKVRLDRLRPLHLACSIAQSPLILLCFLAHFASLPSPQKSSRTWWHSSAGTQSTVRTTSCSSAPSMLPTSKKARWCSSTPHAGPHRRTTSMVSRGEKDSTKTC